MYIQTRIQHWNLTGAPHTVPGDAGAQSMLRSCWSPAASDLAILCCRAAGHRRGRRGAAGPRA